MVFYPTLPSCAASSWDLIPGQWLLLSGMLRRCWILQGLDDPSNRWPPTLKGQPLVGGGLGLGGEREVSWDGLYQSELGSAGIGITVGRPWAAPLVFFSVPVSAADATRTEALGPALASLLLSGWFSVARVCFKGDNSYVVGLLDHSRHPRDIFFFNCIELTRDVLNGWVYCTIGCHAKHGP